MFKPKSELFPFPLELLLRGEQPLLVCLHAEDALCGLLEDHHLGRLLVVGHLWDLVPQGEKAHLEFITSLAFQHVVSPALVVILRV